MSSDKSVAVRGSHGGFIGLVGNIPDQPVVVRGSDGGGLIGLVGNIPDQLKQMLQFFFHCRCTPSNFHSQQYALAAMRTLYNMHSPRILFIKGLVKSIE